MYLNEHQNPVNRWLHVAGTLTSRILLATALFVPLWWLLLVVPVVGYAPAWIGHFMVEGNKPVSIRYPIQSLLADYRLTMLLVTGNHVRLDRPMTKTSLMTLFESKVVVEEEL